MKINNQHIYGGQQQFADLIIHGNKNLIYNDPELLKFIHSNVENESQKVELVRALEAIQDENKPKEEKSKAKEIWKKFLDGGISEIAKETVKGLMSPTLWGVLIS